MRAILNLLTLSAIAILMAYGAVSCTVDSTYDYYTEASEFHGHYNGPIGEDNGHDYFICLSDKGFDADSSYIPGVFYYYFDIFSDSPSARESIMIPEGHYVLGSRDKSIKGTFTPNYSIFVECTAAGNSRQVTFSKGHLEVSHRDGLYLMEAELTDAAGMTHYVRYEGPATLSDESYNTVTEYKTVDTDIEIEATNVAASAYEGPAGNSNVLLSLTDMQPDGEGYALTPGSIVNLDCYMTLTKDGGIRPGQYRLTTHWSPDFTIAPGEMQDGYILGTTVEHYGTDGSSYLGFISDGEVTILREDQTYTVTFTLTTINGRQVSGSYSGPLDVRKNHSQMPKTYTRPVHNPMARAQFQTR